MSSLKVDERIDIRGLICPYTLMETRDTLKKMKKGQVLEVLCDYAPAAETTIPEFCRKKGYPLQTIKEGENQWRLFIERKD